MAFEFNLVQTMAFAVVVYYLGNLIKTKISFLKKYCIPAPVIGGLLFAIVTLIIRNAGIDVSMDFTLQSFCMTVFFTSIGFTSSIKTLIKGGKAVIVFLVIVTVLGLIQNIIGVGLSSVFGLNPLLGLSLGSVSLTGGHGTSGAFGPLIEELGVASATTAAIAAATFGLIVGGIVGGPSAERLIRKNKIEPASDVSDILEKVEENGKQNLLNQQSLMMGTSLLFLSMGIGTIITYIFTLVKITVPAYVGGMLIAAIIRNIFDAKEREDLLPINEIGVIGGVSMNLFLALAMMGLKLWELMDLAIPMIIILVVQTVVTIIFANFITYRAMGKGYDGALFTTAHCGLGLGVTATALANMDSVCEKYGFSQKGYFVVPLVGGLFLDFTNSLLIVTFMNLFK